MHPFTIAFLAALIFATVAQLWLALRQMHHVSRHRGAVPEEFSSSIALSAHEKAADYTLAKGRLGMLDILVGTALLCALTLGGGLQALSDAWAGVFDAGSLAHGIALILSVLAISSLVDLPFGLYRTFVIEARFGFNRMTLGLYLKDMAKNLALGLAIGIPVLAGALWLMAKMGTYWWLWTWSAWMAFALLMTFLWPMFIMPLFNKFSPLEDVALRERIEGLLAKCGFRIRGLYVMDGSKRSSHGNAFFIGFGAARRIVFFDTLIARLSPPEIEAVLAHELGHFALKHIVKRIALMFAASFLFFALLGYLVDQEWFYTGLHVTTPSNAMALVLLMLVTPSFTFLLQPLGSLYSRRHEYQADAYAARHAAPDDLVHALVKLYQDNASTLTPDPLHSAFYDSHPPASLRIARLKSLGSLGAAA